MDKRSDRALAFSEIWKRSREDAGFSQEKLALELGVSKKTIQNWEHGISSPSLFQAEEWFHALNLNPLKYYLMYNHPLLFPESSDNTASTVLSALYTYMLQVSEKERKQLLWIMADRRDKVWSPMLQLCTAHSLLSLETRALSAQIILDAYKMEFGAGKIECKDEIIPDVDMFQDAIDTATDAFKKNQKSIYK